MMKQNYFIVVSLLLVSISSELVAQSPQITDCTVRSRHWGWGGPAISESWGVDLWVVVADPQGLGDIDSVWVDGPNGFHAKLFDDGKNNDGNANDGHFANWIGGLSSPPVLGGYVFKAKDKSGNLIIVADTLTAILDYPRNVTPQSCAVVSTPGFAIGWDKIAGASGCYVNVSRVGASSASWARGLEPSQTSFTYNFDGTGENMIEGGAYVLYVSASDGNSNLAERGDVKFMYSTDPISPVLGYHKLITYHGGDDRGGEDYGYDFWIDVADPQGLSDIASVSLRTPGGIDYKLTDDDGDGRYSWSVRGLSTPSLLGQCVFTVTDKSNNSVTVLDTLTAWIPFARNVRPAYNEVVSTGTPLLSWNAVPGAHHYHLFVDEDNGPRVWGGIDVYDRTSITYNEDGNGRNLVEGKQYWWHTYAYDDKGNYGYHYGTRFAYSTNPTLPVPMSPAALSAHYGNDRGGQTYYLVLRIQVADPQGLSDIASVVVTGPGGKTYAVKDDNNDGYYDTWFGSSTEQPQIGAYRFRVTDKSGNWAEAVDTLTAVMDYPRNVRPVNNEVISTTTPTFSWNAVQGATRYYVWVNDGTGKQIWWRDNVTTMSVVYNDNGNAKESLKDGSTYTWAVGASDADNNWGEQNPKFTYSTNPTSPNVGGHRLVTYHGGDDRGGEDYGYDYWIDVTDPQGLGDIVSVTMTTPDGLTYQLHDDATHGDGVAGDGRYSGGVRGLTARPSLGQCRFVVTDRSSNTATVSDTLSAWVPYARNVHPVYNELVQTSLPVFRWDSVAGVSSYTLRVIEGGTQLWSLNVKNRTSVTYNENGTGPNLQEGKRYWWDVYAWDARGNYGYHYGTYFTYSSNPTSPIINDPQVRSRHWVQGDLSESWGIDCWMNVNDPQGLTDIDSAWVDGPNGFHVTLYDDGNHSDNSARDGKYAYWIGGLSTPPITGEYRFKVVDKSGNLMTASDTLTAVISYPKNVAPQHNAVVSTPGFAISWDRVEGAEWYEAKILTRDWSKQLWSSGRISNLTSIQYNTDGTGEPLTEGGIYYLIIWAGDKQYDGDEAERVAVKIAYRLNNRRVVYVDSSNTSGNENGTASLPFNTVTEALSGSVRGDTVSVATGTYNENVFLADGIALLGRTPISTRINGYVSIGPGLTNVVVRGFTVRCLSQSCIDIYTSSVIITNNIILDSPHSGINVLSGSPIIYNNTIVGNGGGITAGSAGSSVRIHNNIIYGNKGTGVSFVNGSTAQFSYNNVFGNPTPYSGITLGEGNIFVSPKVVDSSKKDYRLSSDSPCIDAGNPDLNSDGLTWKNDPTDRDPDGTRLDMGALYFDQRTLFPSTPQNVSAMPADRTVVLRWVPNSEFNIAYYKIYRSFIHGFTPETKDSIAVVLRPDTSYADRNVTNGQMYYYRISAVNIVENESPFSEEANAMPGKLISPSLVAPPNGALNQWTTVALSWNPSATAISYHLQVSADSTFGATIVDDSTITDITREISLLNFNTVYYWRVSATNIAGSTGFSPAWKLTTIPTAPTTITLASPSDGSANVPVGVALKWDAAIGVMNYHVQVSANLTFSPVIFDSLVSVPSCQLSGLQNNTTYYWRVRWKNVQDYGAYSSVWSFTTIVALPGTVTLSAPPNGTAGVPVNVTLTWTETTGVTNYHLQLSTSAAFTTALLDDTTITAVSRQVESLANSTTYYWRVRGKNVAGYGPYSGIWAFTTILAPPTVVALMSPSDGSAGISTVPLLKWGAASGAAGYHVQLSTTSGFAPLVIDDSTLTATSRLISSLANNTAYYWRARAKNAGGYGLFSPAWSFTTIPVYPNSISINANIVFASKPNASDYGVTDYRIIGLPGASDILAKDLATGAQNEDWEIVWDNGAASNYIKRYDGSNDFKFSTGKAFWIISKTPLSISKTVPSAALNAAQEAEIPLRSGWNLITNPYDQSIPWSRIQTTNGITGAIYSFNGAFNNSTTFDPYAGYYFFNGTPSPVLTTLRVPYSSIFGKVAELGERKEDGWRIEVEVRSQDTEDRLQNADGRLEKIEIGVERDAKDGLDGYDQRMPRSLEKAGVYFDRPGWDRQYNEFGRDIRAETNELKKWEFSVEGKLFAQRTISVQGVESIPQSEEVLLVDKERGVTVNLREKNAYAFEMVKGKMAFEILVGKRESVDEETRKLMPTEIKVGPNYPNPFNPETIIPIELPKAMEVKVVVYDILGRAVKTLFDGIMESGRHYVRWDGRDGQQQKVNSGVYFFRFETPARQYAGKLLFLQ